MYGPVAGSGAVCSPNGRVRRDDLSRNARQHVQERRVASREMEGHRPSVVVRDDAVPEVTGLAFPHAAAPTIAPNGPSAP